MKTCDGRGEGGFSSIHSAVGLAVAVLVLTLAANLVAMQYTRGALRAAVLAGARTGALAGGTVEACEERAEGVLRGETGLLRGPYGADAHVTCARLAGTVRASGIVTVAWWFEYLPPVELRVSAESAVEAESLADHMDSLPSNGLSLSE